MSSSSLNRETATSAPVPLPPPHTNHPGASANEDSPSRNQQVSDTLAISLAQGSIDRSPNATCANARGDAGESDCEELATALELLGSLDLGPFSQSTEDLDRPLKLGRFEGRNEQGRGGFGIVYRAFDPFLQREIALKIPRLDRLLAGQPPHEFVHEARTAARLEHPAIVRVYEVQQLGPLWYIASAFCAGPTLAQWLAHSHRAMTWRQAAQLICDIADAVHYAHTRGVLHLDLKPDNILLEIPEAVDEFPRPMVTDFGLASRSDNSSAPSPGRIAGTLAYMAPEQRIGDTQKIGVAADIFGLGAMLHDLLAGVEHRIDREPNETTTNSALPCAPPRPSLPNLPRDLDAICQKCLAHSPDERYGSARELANDLKRLLRGETVTARVPSWREALLRWARRRPLVAALGSLLLLTLTISALTIVRYWRLAEFNLSQLRAEQAVHAQTAERMRRSLLNLTWMTQENRLPFDQPTTDGDGELEMLQSFYRDVQAWSAENSDQAISNLALRAAGHSLALANGVAALDESRVKAEFLAGVKSWQAIIEQDPLAGQWRRALALHFLTFAAKFHPPQWLWWQQPANGNPAVDRTVLDLLEEPYAQLLVEYARKPASLGTSPAVVSEMYVAAIALFQSRRNLPDPDGVRDRSLLTAYNGLSMVSERRSSTTQSREALRQAESLASQAPPPAACPRLLAVAVAETAKLQARALEHSEELAPLLAALDRAAQYYERALSLSPSDATLRSTLSNVYRSAGMSYVRRSEHALAIGKFQNSMAVLDKGIELAPGHRNLTRLRASTAWDLSNSQIAVGDTSGAETSLRISVHDFQDLDLRKHDSGRLWIQAVRSWQDLGQLYADKNQKAEAIAAYQASVKVLEQFKSRRGHSAEYRQYADKSSRSLAKLGAPVRRPPVQAEQ